MKRALAHVVALAAAALVLGWLAAPAPASALPSSTAVPAHAYDGQQHAAEESYTTAERGPPAADYPPADYGTVGQWSRGPSVCPDIRAPSTTYTYDHPLTLVPSDGVDGGTAVRVGHDPVAVASLVLRRVAANTAPEVASGLERTGTALSKSDAFHRSVSWVVDNPNAQRFAIKGGDGVGRELYQLPGEVNGKSGVFEWIIDRSGANPVINHQRFIPGGSVTGYPNRVVP